MKLKEKTFETINKCRGYVSGAVILGGIYLSTTLNSAVVFASTKFDTSFLDEKGDGSFDDLTTKVEGAGASFRTLIMTGSIILLLLSIVFLGTSLAMNHKNSTKREENKTGLIWIAVGGIVIFGAMTFVTVFQTIGENLAAK